MPSGSKKSDFKSSEQYLRQLAHSRAWKARNHERVRAYNRRYSADRRKGEREESDTP